MQITIPFVVIALAGGAIACSSAPPTPPAHRGQPVGGDGDGDHGAHAGHSGEDGAALLAAEQDALAKAQPILSANCAPCHTSAGTDPQRETALPHFNMDAYPFGGHHATEMAAEMREVLGASGSAASMPKDNPGAVSGADLDLVLAWANAFEASHAAGLHDHGGGHGDHGGHGEEPAKTNEHDHGSHNH